MQYISLERFPNQSFTIEADNKVISITLRYFRGLTFASATSSSGDDLTTMHLAVDKGWLFPKRFESLGYGNMRFEDDNGEYPDYRNFNGSCVLVYYTKEEAAEARKSEEV